MPKKQILTKANMETDIKNVLKNPANMSRFEYRKSVTPPLIFSAIALVAMLVFQNYYKLVLLISLVFIAAYLAVDCICQKNSIKNVSLDDYEVSEEVVLNVIEDTYSTNNRSYINKKLSEVRAYIMRFENGKSWNIPDDNYVWSVECSMSDKALYQLAKEGDVFIVVTKKDTFDIVVAYPAEYFEYKN